jgi:hypothetical protein
MTIKEFRSQLLTFKEGFTAELRFTYLSIKAVQRNATSALEFLDSSEYEDELKKRVEQSKKYLKEAYDNADIFAKGMKPDPDDKDVGAIHNDELFWYQEVIGTAEAAMTLILHYLDGNE